MSYEASSGRSKGGMKGIIVAVVLVLLGLLAWFVVTAEKESEADKKYTFECNAERVEFLNTLGYIVEPDPESEDITIPAEFNEAYTKYNDLQKKQGFDLEPYKDREATKYTYRVLNYPDHAENTYINLIFDDHRLIGADITCNDAENGFTAALISETMQTSLNISAASEEN